MLLLSYSLGMLLLWAGASAFLIVNSRKISYLRNQPPLADEKAPRVAVVIAVKDEEAEVEEALHSVCQLDYPAFRVVVVNDRSTDRTPAILERMATNNPLLTLLTIDSLPAGWLGKNHALYQGYRASSEEWLLFTDADVKFAPQTLRKAMHYVQQKGLDHLTALPEITSSSRLFMSVMNTFALMLFLKLRPWALSNPSSKASMGVGAFNLVKRSAYEKSGTHRVISLRPDDDLKLGEQLKKAGFRQDVVFGDSEIWLQWYTGLGAFVKGLMKNTFSVARYNVFLAAGMALATFLTLVLPVPLLLLSGYPYFLAGCFILLLQMAVFGLAKGIKAQGWQALVIPFAGLVMVYIILRSAVVTLRQGGIYWRDSFYPLSELKKQA